MKSVKLPQSLRKYIRLEKARIRRGNSGVAEEKADIAKMYERIGVVRTQSVK